MLLAFLIYPLCLGVWIFIVWVLWTIAQSLKNIALSVEVIARSHQTRE